MYVIKNIVLFRFFIFVIGRITMMIIAIIILICVSPIGSVIKYYLMLPPFICKKKNNQLTC